MQQRSILARHWRAPMQADACPWQVLFWRFRKSYRERVRQLQIPEHQARDLVHRMQAEQAAKISEAKAVVSKPCPHAELAFPIKRNSRPYIAPGRRNRVHLHCTGGGLVRCGSARVAVYVLVRRLNILLPA